MRSDKDKEFDVCQEHDLCEGVTPELLEAAGTTTEWKPMGKLNGTKIRDRCRARLLDCVRRDLRDSYMSSVCSLPSESKIREQFGLSNESDDHVSIATTA